MVFSKLRTAAGATFALIFLAAGLGAVARVGAQDPDQIPDEVLRQAVGRPPASRFARPRETTDAGNRETRSLTLRDAIRIGLENYKGVRVVSTSPPAGGSQPDRGGKGREPGAFMVIAPRSADADRQRFRGEILAEVRSVEQQYWSLLQKLVEQQAAARAVELAEETLKREQSEFEVGRGTKADISEVEQRLEGFRLDLVTKTSDVITAERRLRNLLGLPPADDRRIVPVTAPTEARVDPDWDESLATMLVKQPDVAWAIASVKKLEARQAEALQDTVNVKSSQEALMREREFLKQIVHQTTHSLARFFLEVDANYKQFKTASRFRAAAVERLKQQRIYHEQGRITIDRYLDAVSQHASAVAQEAQFKTSYNISIVALEEVKGTLLAFDGISVVGEPSPDHLDALKIDAKKRLKEIHQEFSPAPTAPPSPSAVASPTPARLEAMPPVPETRPSVTRSYPAGTTVSFHWKLDFGARPIEIRGSFTVTPARAADEPKQP